MSLDLLCIMYVCVGVSVSIRYMFFCVMHIYMFVYMYVYAYMCVYVCMYEYLYVCIYYALIFLYSHFIIEIFHYLLYLVYNVIGLIP